MKNQLRKKGLMTIVILMGLTMQIFSQVALKPNGIGFRGGPYMMDDQGTDISITSHNGVDEINVGGFGGWIYLFSRLQNKFYLDLTLGGAAKVEERSSYYSDNLTDVYTINPLLIGFHYDFLSEQNESSLRPYIGAGVGPYWINHIRVNDCCYDEEVHIGSKMNGGGYLGSGINLPVKGWLGINFDMKYHFVNFDAEYKFSGFEYGIGVHFMWGKPINEKKY